MQLALGHGGRLAQVEERTPTTHRRLLGFNRRPLPVVKNGGGQASREQLVSLTHIEISMTDP